MHERISNGVRRFDTKHFATSAASPGIPATYTGMSAVHCAIVAAAKNKFVNFERFKQDVGNDAAFTHLGVADGLLIICLVDEGDTDANAELL